MRLLRLPLVAFVVVLFVLGACSDDKPAANGSSSTNDQASPDSSAANATQPPSAGGEVDCEALKGNLADILVNWQVVIGLSSSPTSEWAQVPLGSLPKFGEQLAAVSTALSNDADASASLSYMSGANDIVARGLGGDSTAQADLATYMGADVAENVGKQLPISLAYQNAGCK